MQIFVPALSNQCNRGLMLRLITSHPCLDAKAMLILRLQMMCIQTLVFLYTGVMMTLLSMDSANMVYVAWYWILMSLYYQQKIDQIEISCDFIVWRLTECWFFFLTVLSVATTKEWIVTCCRQNIPNGQQAVSRVKWLDYLGPFILRSLKRQRIRMAKDNPSPTLPYI